ncbi:hypothetical protein [Allorhizocola rhizosphaerae]|uniref:hypothetical protein n=1 Tax=Allorhizocola rhizosphaerae TaxID=1872709 RepID=UPI000E3C5D57|nr:hypothetical protein [Allorhizocola rhizosphaerae]
MGHWKRGLHAVGEPAHAGQPLVLDLDLGQALLQSGRVDGSGRRSRLVGALPRGPGDVDGGRDFAGEDALIHAHHRRIEMQARQLAVG